MGKVTDMNMDIIYTISNGAVVLNTQPWCNGDGYTRDCYQGAHIVSDPNWEEEDGEAKSGKVGQTQLLNFALSSPQPKESKPGIRLYTIVI